MDFAGVKKGLADNSFVLLDVRNPGEHQEGKIPGANNLPLGDIESALKLSSDDFKSKYSFDLPAKDAAVVTHCLKGGRAGKAVEALKAAGYTNVQAYSGSFEDWKAKGGEIVKP